MSEARRLLGDDKIIGVSASTVDEAIEAAKGGADYIGIGAIYATNTKTNTKKILGSFGVKEIMQALEKSFPRLQTVGIGGINENTVIDVMTMGATPRKRLDGVAVVSAIMAAEDPKAAAQRLLKHVVSKVDEAKAETVRGMVASAPDIIAAVFEKKPLSHNMTNTVCISFQAGGLEWLANSPRLSKTLRQTLPWPWGRHLSCQAMAKRPRIYAKTRARWLSTWELLMRLR